LKHSEFAKHATLGFEFFATIALFAYLGYKLDFSLSGANAFPLFLIVGVFVGLSLAVYRLCLKFSNSEDSDD
jgi:F0F1-type ATP synthase assembly protein I|tara:strand:- start:544 stop:759 length:216 start_codon:yes stop_codon:yes gene_type:complete